MTEQLPLLRPAPHEDPSWLAEPSSAIERNFRAYHRANPHVYARLEQAALEWASYNPTRVGVKRLAEDLRYSDLRTVPDQSSVSQPFKLNNSHTALYARLLVHRHPSLETVIERRVRKEEGASV